MTRNDLSPRDFVRRRRDIVTRALTLLDAWGYDEAEVPLLAPFDDLRTAVGDRAEQLHRFVDRDGRLLVLRGDVTPLIAWQLARAGVAGVARVAYANRIARLQASVGRTQAESYVVGLERVGPGGADADLEVLAIAAELLDALGVEGWEVTVGHVGLAAGCVQAAGLTGVAADAALEAVRRRDPATVRSLAADASPADRDRLAALCAFAPTRADLTRVAAGAPDDVALAARSLGDLLDAAEAIGPGDRVRVDLTARDERGYYTGAVFRWTCDAIGAPIGAGGRYDRLLGLFGADAPAVGFTLRVDRLVQALGALPGEDATAAAERVSSVVAAVQARRRGARVIVDDGGAA